MTTDSTIRNYLYSRMKTQLAQNDECTWLNLAERYAKFPKNYRKAVSSDIVKNAVIWYKEGDSGPFWCIVEEVENPSDQYKAYTAQNGCRYGLDGAFVETPNLGAAK